MDNEDLEKELQKHIGHKVEILKQSNTLLELKCLTCNKVLMFNWDIVGEEGGLQKERKDD